MSAVKEKENSQFLTAINLNAILKEIPQVLKPLGTCITHIMDFRRESGLSNTEESNSDEDGKPELMEAETKRTRSIKYDIHKFIVNVKKNIPAASTVFYSSDWSPLLDNPDHTVIIDTENFKYTIQGGSRWKNNKNPELIKQLYDNAPIKQGGFGDTLAQETKVDESVRKARDYYFSSSPPHNNGGHFFCSDALVNAVVNVWSKNMYPGGGAKAGVRAVPYKINCYAPDGKFEQHKDTPDLNMIGTVLVGLGQGEPESPPASSQLISHLVAGEFTYESTKITSVCCFYTDVPHSVIPTGYYRATLSFKIYLDNPEFSRERVSDVLLAEAKRVLPSDTTVGFLLSHKYSHSSTALKGLDAIFCDILLQSNLYKSLEIIPVLVTVNGIQSENEDYHLTGINSLVYEIGDENLKLLAQNNNKEKDEQAYSSSPKKEDDSSILFFLISNGYTWSHLHEEGAEHTGNESRPEDLESVYLQKAILCHPK